MSVRCKECGGANVQIAMWVNPNTGKTIDDFGSFDEADTKWCNDCDSNELLIDDGVATPSTQGDLEILTTLCQQAFKPSDDDYGQMKRGEMTRAEYDAARLARSDAKDAIRAIVFNNRSAR